MKMRSPNKLAYVTASPRFLLDGNGNVGILGSAGGGGYGGVSGSGGVIVQITNANSIYDLGGLSAQSGGSAGEFVTGGLEYVQGLNNSYSGINISLGIGGGLTPVELHSIVEYAGVKGVNVYDLLNYTINTLLNPCP